ncbi:hypothetical protein [Spirosoma montaniterrae]|uniref:Uncharacterized protein n=1 Tax=Spirosoma montaniterrae TaxID=1178516 RepID=A0A1P9X1V2_9BACT|nr:hypothetical protein [Spirosoma montaniterrae]AQG81616.1 hypothetical protein AWR27_21275 [Spirosoma montaniterrae]
MNPLRDSISKLLFAAYCLIGIVNAPTRAANVPADEEVLTVGISSLMHEETNVSEQFALFQFFTSNPLLINGKPVEVLLADQPFFANFAISGVVGDKGVDLKVWQEGKILKRVRTTFKAGSRAALLNTIYEAVAQAMFAALNVPPDKSFSKGRSMRGVLVYPPAAVNAERGSDLLPGFVPCPVPNSGFLNDAFVSRSTINIQTPKRLDAFKDPVQIGQLGYALYDQPDESYFLLRNTTVPDAIKTNVRKLAFPVYSRPGLPLVYLAAGERFEQTQDPAGAASAYQAALIACNNLHTSPFEKAAIKQAAFGRLAELARQREQPQTATLMKLARDLNLAYLNSGLAAQEGSQYYSIVKRVGSICDRVEAQARQVRAQKRKNGFMALTSLASGIAGVASADNAGASSQAIQSTAETYGKQALDYLGQSGQLTQEAEAAMADVSSNFALLFEDRIEAMADDDAEQIVAGQTYLAREITYHLLHSPLPEIEQLLLDFTVDKGRTGALLMNYFATTTEGQRVEQIMALRKQLNKVEALTYLYESRGNNVPANLRKEF